MEIVNIKDIPELLIKSPLLETLVDNDTVTIPKQYFSNSIFTKDNRLNIQTFKDIIKLLQITDYWCIDIDISSELIIKYAMKIFTDDQFKKSSEKNKEQNIESLQQLNIPLAKELLFLLTFKKKNYKNNKYFDPLLESKKNGITFGYLNNKEFRYLIYRIIKNNYITLFKYFDIIELINYSTDVYMVSLFGSLEILKYMNQTGYDIKSNLGHSYLYNDQNEILEYLIDNGYFYHKTVNFTKDDCCLLACKSSAPKCLELFHKRGHPLLINLKYLTPYKDTYSNQSRFEQCIKYVLEHISDEDLNYQCDQEKYFDDQIINYCVIHNLFESFKIAIDKGYKCDTNFMVLCANYDRTKIYNYFLKVCKHEKN